MTTSSRVRFRHPVRRRFGVAFALIGLLVSVLGADPGVFGLDRSPVIGFVQMAVFLIGMLLVCFGGYLAIESLWRGRPKSIAFDIGVRLVATGYVLAFISALADVFGLGTRPLPFIPFFGYWQARGVFVAQVVIIIGLLLMVPYRLPAEEPTGASGS